YAIQPQPAVPYVRGTRRLLHLLAAVGVPPPVYVAWSLIGAKNCVLNTNRLDDHYKPIDSNFMELPEVEIRDLIMDESTLTQQMRPALDVLWQSIGRPRYD